MSVVSMQASAEEMEATEAVAADSQNPLATRDVGHAKWLAISTNEYARPPIARLPCIPAAGRRFIPSRAFEVQGRCGREITRVTALATSRPLTRSTLPGSFSRANPAAAESRSSEEGAGQLTQSDFEIALSRYQDLAADSSLYFPSASHVVHFNNAA